MSQTAAVRPLGDASVLVDTADQQGALAVARVVEDAARRGGFGGIEEVIVGARAVTVVLTPDGADSDGLADWLRGLLRAAPPPRPAGQGEAPGAPDPVELVVRFDGPDLQDVATATGRCVADVVEWLTDASLRVAFLGFSPGFAYLEGLPPELAAVPRRDRPRPMVPAGTLALGGGYAAVYPQATPGGWHLVGRTGAALFDADRPPYARLVPGQRVTLRATDEDPPSPPVLRRPVLDVDAANVLRVEDGGVCTLVEDGGRVGVASVGVPRAGTADRVAARLANRLLGNDDDAAVLEVTVRGPRLRSMSDTHLCLIGDTTRPGLVGLRVDGHAVPDGVVVPVAAGSVVDVGPCDAAVRAVLAVAGGLHTPTMFGSRSSDLLCALGPPPLRAGDVLGVGIPGRPRGRLDAPPRMAASATVTELRVLLGPDAPSGLDCLVADEDWVVAPESNRVGLRLHRAARAADTGGRPAVASRGMVTGAVQLPPGGEAIVLGPDHATVGGYPVPAVVIGADHHHLAHLAPGDAVRFVAVDAAEAASARRALAAVVDGAVSGWFPTRAG